MIKYLTAGFIITILIVGTRIWLDSNETKQVAQVEAPIPLDAESFNEMSSGAIAQPNLDQSSAADAISQTAQNFEVASSQEASTPPAEIWSEVDYLDPVPEKFLSKGLNPQALKISQAVLQKLTMGDEVSISIPQLGQSYSMDIEQIRRYTNGDRTVKGHLQNTDLPYSVIITTGTQSSYATINTPDGAYVMEANGDDGWIMSVANLDYLVDTNLDDFQIPDINRQLN